MAAHYDSYDYVQYWDGRNYEHESEAVAITSFLDIINRPLSSIADIGCGFGRLYPIYKNSTKHIHLVEPSKKLLSKAKEILSKRTKNKKVTFQQSSVENLPNILKPVDALLMIRVMHHLQDPMKGLTALSDCIKPGGYLILEFANKMHGKAQLKQLRAGNLLYPFEIFPEDKRSTVNKTDTCIPFYNYHPDIIFSYLKDLNFDILETRSVSNIRSRRLKRILPLRALIEFERKLQKPLAKVHFGPSIFVLAHKKAA